VGSDAEGERLRVALEPWREAIASWQPQTDEEVEAAMHAIEASTRAVSR
jgi:hypothetical protein